MVSTRQHPRSYQPHDTPSKRSGSPDPDADEGTVTVRGPRSTRRSRSSRSLSPTPESPTKTAGAAAYDAPPALRKAISASSARPAMSTPRTWAHTPSNLTVVWLAVSVPLVAWDTGYVLLRPYTFPGGSLHAPLWKPYALYGEVDYMYGLPAWEASNGFTAAQGVLNLVESVLYVAYLWLAYRYGSEAEAGAEEGKKQGKARGRSKKQVSSTTVEGRGAPGTRVAGWLGQARTLGGGYASAAVLLGFTASVMTVSKTWLYLLNEWLSGWQYTRHNDAMSLVFLWIIPNGAWLVFPTYMMYVFGVEIFEGLAAASGAGMPQVLMTKED